MATKNKEKSSFLDISIFGLRLKPWQGILVGIIIQMIFTRILGSLGQIIAGLGGILIIASFISLIRNFINSLRNKKSG